MVTVVQYQELFAICQALPGPGSTKMLFCIVLIHAGILTALLTFLIWRLVLVYPSVILQT